MLGGMFNKGNPMKRVNYYLSELQLDKLKKLSTETGISVSEIIRRAVDKYLALCEKGRV